MRSGAVTLFWRQALFDEAKVSLRQLDYTLLEVVCDTTERLVSEMSSGLNWAAQFGYEPWTGNLNALRDGLTEVPFGQSGCLALCFQSFHRVVDQNDAFARGLLDVVEYQSRNHLLQGRRLLALVQTDNASFWTEKLGGRAAQWNRGEWLTSTRGLAANKS